MKTITEIAASNGRDYITPEDVSEALRAGATVDSVRQQVLQAIADKGAEDPSCCAYVAVRGTPTPPEPPDPDQGQPDPTT